MGERVVQLAGDLVPLFETRLAGARVAQFRQMTNCRATQDRQAYSDPLERHPRKIVRRHIPGNYPADDRGAQTQRDLAARRPARENIGQHE